MAQQTATPNTKLIHALNSLIHLDYDAVRAYEAAIERLDDPADKATVSGFCDDHRRHITDLQGQVRKHGGEPADSADVMRVLTEGMVILRGTVQGDHGVYAAMKLNEVKTNAAYEAALKMEGLPNDLRALLQKNLGDERRHLAWFQAKLDQEKGGKAKGKGKGAKPQGGQRNR